MKQKYPHQFALRALAITATLAAAANAAVISLPPPSDYTTTAGSVADTIQANAGGTSVTVIAGSTLTGNAAGSPALSVNATGYTINNSGTLTGNGAAPGATVGATTTINNNLATAKINSVAQQGISITAGTGSTITNKGAIEGGDDGIRTATNGLTVTNAAGGTISGLVGAGSDGIQALDGLTLNNSGTVGGVFYGVNAGATATITNTATGVLTGITRGLSATTGLVVLNGGVIRSTAAAGTANSNAINATDGTITNTGTITGVDRGILFTGAGAGTVINSGAISGVVGIGFAATADTLTMTAGSVASITGIAGTAVSFAGGNDILNLGAGTITGIVDGNTGIDTANFNGALSTDIAVINGNLVAFETITKTGLGNATINGTTTADTITVGGGFMSFNGNVGPSSTPTTTINLTGGVLDGISTVAGWNAVINQTGGSLSAGASPTEIGTLTIGTAGGIPPKLTVGTGGDLMVHMNPATSAADLVKVNGNAIIAADAGSVRVSPTTRDAPLQNGTTTVLNVSGTRTGAFAAATFRLGASATDTGAISTGSPGAFTSSTVSLLLGNTANDTSVTVVHRYDAVAGLGAFGQQFGATLNGRVAESLTNPVLADFLGYLDYSDATTVATVMNAYDPNTADFQTSLGYSVVSAREIHRIVEQQNAGERMVPGGPHVWGNFNYGDYSNGGSSSRFTFGGGGTIDSFRYGALVSYAQSDLNDNSDVQSLSYGAYFGLGGSAGWQWNGYIGGSHGDTTSNRSIATSPGVFSSVNFEPDGDGFQALLSGAYMVAQDTWAWGPTFGFEYTSADLEGSLNTGANRPEMAVSADKLESLRSLLGLRAECTWGDKVHPYVSAQWAHEFDGESNGYTASFQGQSFAVASPFALATDTVILRAGMVIQLGETSFGDLGYLGEYSISDDGGDYSGLNLGVRAAF